MKKELNFNRRKNRTRIKIKSLTDKPRICVYKSNRFMYVQTIDSDGNVIGAVSDKSLGKLGKLGKNNIDRMKELGKMIAEKLLKKKVKDVVFDRSGYRYHGRVKAVAQGAREGGLVF